MKLWSLVFLFLIGGSVEACDICAVKRVVVADPHVVTQTTIINRTIVNPTYTVTYDTEAAALLKEVRGIRADLRAAIAGPANPGDPAPAPQVKAAVVGDRARLLTLMQNKCAGCHAGDKTAATLGGGQVLLEEDGSFPKDGYAQAEMSMIPLYVQPGKYPTGKSCPPGRPLTAAEQQFIGQQMKLMHAETRNKVKAKYAAAQKEAAEEAPVEKAPPPPLTTIPPKEDAPPPPKAKTEEKK